MNDEQRRELYYEIIELLESHKEGDYWDFKQEWPESNEDLVHDILCFANTSHSHDCYLVFGLSDDFRLTGCVKKRMKQSNVLDTLANVKFAGDNRPEITLETISIGDKQVDVLIVHNSLQTPYFLSSKYGKLMAGNIYTRVGDKNTSISSVADYITIELLWKKRFHLLVDQIRFFQLELKNEAEWDHNGKYFFHRKLPLYTITEEVDDGEYNDDKHEFYSYLMMNNHTSFSQIALKYGDTVLKTIQTVWLDGGRLFAVIPEWGFIHDGLNHINVKYRYKYYICNSIEYEMNEFLFNDKHQEECIARRRLMEVVLLFNDLEERDEFEKYVHVNFSAIDLYMMQLNALPQIDTKNKLEIEWHQEKIRNGLAMKYFQKLSKEEKQTRQK